MSADNGIYILKSRDTESQISYRVANIHAIENLFRSDGTADLDKVEAVFADSSVFYSVEEANSSAETLKRELLVEGLELEYGILHIEMENSN